MNNEKPVYKKNDFLAPNKLIAILSYLLCLFVLSSLIFYLVAFIYSKIASIDFNQIIDCMTNTNDEIIYSEEVLNANYVSQGITNLIAYLLAFILIVFYMRDDLVNDFKKIKKKHLWLIPLTSVLFVLCSYGIDEIVKLFVDDSNNQNTIINIMTSGGGTVSIIIAVTLFAPVIEELIYRKCVFSYLKKYGIVVCYIASMLLFSLPHMLSTKTDILTWVIQLIPYLLAGGMLCFVYQVSGYNIYASIFAHMLQNIVSTIIVLMKYVLFIALL
ncbi:MAG: lysostaphin resistance A-like protein [Anaeroplasma sp.]